MTSPVPAQVLDPARLAAVRATALLDTPAEEDFDRLARLASLLLDAPFAFVTVVDETRSFWKSCIGVDSADPADRQNAVEESFCQYVVGTGEALIVGDTAADPRTADNPSIESMRVAAWAGFPVHSPDGQVLGSFCVVDTVPRSWTDRDRMVLRTLAAAASSEIALRSAMNQVVTANEAARKSQDRLTFLADISEALTTNVDAETAVGALAQRITPFLADWCLISVVDDTTGRRRDLGRSHRDPAMLAAVHRYADLHSQSEVAPIPTAIRTGKPYLLPVIDAATIERSLPHPESRAALAELAPLSASVFPLKGHGDPFGAVALYNSVERGAPTGGELGIAEEMTRRAGLLLDNARLYTRQRRLAEALQRSLLTPPPRVEGLELAVRYRPATEGSRVGGDWYDAYVRSDSTIALVMGDVVGHDLQAVGAMGQIRTMTRSIGFDRGNTPAQTLTRVDEAMRGLGVGSLCTVLVVHLDLGAARDGAVPFTWSSAGHPLPIVVRADGTPQPVESEPEMLLGVRTSARRTDHTGSLPIGATMVLMTDGLFERRDQALADSFGALRSLVAGLAARPLESLCDTLLAGVDADARDDDVALLALRVGG